MKIDCHYITNEVLSRVKLRLEKIIDKKRPPRVALIYVGSDKLTDIFIEHKVQAAKKLGIVFDVIYFSKIPLFQAFASKLRIAANSSDYHAVIVQKPLPPELSSTSLDNYIPLIKEIEGKKYKSPYISPIGKVVLSLLKYVYVHDWRIKPSDSDFFKKTFKKQFIVVAGRGDTSGKPIARTLMEHKIPSIITHSNTPNCDIFYKQSDILITTTGKPIINKNNIKPGSILINFGYRRENGKTLGDYNESEIAGTAGYYTSIIGGTGPLMIAYLMENIVTAYASQKNKITRAGKY